MLLFNKLFIFLQILFIFKIGNYTLTRTKKYLKLKHVKISLLYFFEA